MLRAFWLSGRLAWPFIFELLVTSQPSQEYKGIWPEAC